MRVALDAMGGDRGSRILVQGAAAAAETGEVEVSLVGAEDVLRQDISALSLAPDVASRLHIVHASEVVEMCDNPVNAIRKKKRCLCSCRLSAGEEGRGLCCHQRREFRCYNGCRDSYARAA